MIQIYRPNNTDYERNGDMSLFPSSAEVYAILNDLWEVSLKHPLDQEGRWKYLEEDAVIKMPSFNGSQLFRIRKIHKSDSAITCSMEPIFFDSIDDCFLEDVRPTEKNGQAALEIMLSPNSKYSAKSDIKKIATAYYQDVNFMEALNGDVEQAFVKRWGGEICYDNFTVIAKEQIGSDNGVELRYGKNIKKNGLTEEIDTREVVTRIKPKAYNGHTMSGTGFVDSPNIDKYTTIRIRTIKFEDVKMAEDALEDDAENGVIICNTQDELDAALLQKCQEQYELGLDKPKVTITANMILLQNTDLYKEFSDLETVSLGDTVHCRHNGLGIVTDARVIALRYDSIRKKVSSVTIGDYANDYFSRIDSSVEKLEKEIKSPDSSFRKSMQKLIDDMAASIAGYDGGNMLITKNSEGKPNGIMIMDTDSKETAKKILWLNLNGITYSCNGANGPFNAVWSFEQGGFVADWIVTGTMLANRIKGGALQLGGAGNGNGVLKIFDASSTEVGSWDKDGITAKSGEIAGWKISKTQIYKTIDLYSDMTSTGLASVGDSDPVQYWVWMRNPTAATTPVFFVGYKTKSDYLNNVDSANTYFRVRTNGNFFASTGQIGRWVFNDKDFIGNKADGSSGFLFGYFEERDEFKFICDGVVEAGRMLETKDCIIWGDLTVYGEKNRAVKIDEKIAIKMSAYETASPYFGDIGCAEIRTDGTCTVEIDKTFSKTVSLAEYAVFLQAEGPGELYVKEKTATNFIVSGSPGTKFSYEIKAKQKGFENKRLEVAR